jgi:ribosomal protein RSM22 (predicted rRNA methylase)
MRLPQELADAIQVETDQADRTKLSRASAQLTQCYKAADFSSPVIKSQAHRAAYLAARVPATYAANLSVYTEVCRLLSPAQPHVTSLLDLGAGPGTALWAAAETFSGLRSATLVESDKAWLQLGQRMAAHSPHAVVREARWIRQDLCAGIDCPVHDLVVISYTLGELTETAARTLLLRAWNLAGRLLAVIEPGTPRGFQIVHAARTALLQSHAKMIAPCPHGSECPMAVTGDWCHFAERLPRTSLHRQLKGGALGYEDEKFSYVAVSRDDCIPAPSRIVRHPQRHSGHILLTLCSQQGIESQTVTRSQGKDYARARRAEWGDSWNK